MDLGKKTITGDKNLGDIKVVLNVMTVDSITQGEYV